MEENENIERHLKQQLENFTAEPRLTSFEMIQEKLRKRKKRRFFIVFFSGLGVLGTLILLQLPVRHQKTLSVTTEVPQTKNINASDPYKDNGKLNPEAETKSLQSIDAKHPENKNKSKKQVDPTNGNNIPSYQRKITAKATYKETPDKNASEQILIVGTVHKPEKENEGREKERPGMVENMIAPRAVEDALVEYLQPISLTLPISPTETEVVVNFSEMPETPPSLDKKSKVKLLIGFHYNPQMGRNLLTANSQRESSYDSGPNTDFSTEYLKNRKSQEKIRYSQIFGIKAGLIYDDTWEFLAGVALSKYQYTERVFSILTPVIQSLSGNGLAYNSQPPSGTGFENFFKYLTISFETSKIVKSTPFIRFKTGIGLQVNHLIRSQAYTVVNSGNYDVSNQFLLNKSMYSAQLKLGVIKPLGKRAQLQITPYLYGAFNSMFYRNYIIKQNPFGLGVEGMLAFKFG